MYEIPTQNSLILIIVLMITFSSNASFDELQPEQRVLIRCDTTVYETVLFFIKIPLKDPVFISGDYKTQTDDSIFILDSSEEPKLFGISKEKVNSVYISTGKRRATVDGLLLGTGIGALLSVFTMYGALAGYPKDENEHPNERGNIAIRVGAFCLLGGAIIGTLAGSQTEVDKWCKVEKSKWSVDLDANIQKEKIQIELSLNF